MIKRLLIRLAVIAAAFSCASGCEGPTPERMTGSGDPRWTDQIAAVRAGTTDRIQVTREPVGDDQLSLLDAPGLRELILDSGRVTDAGLAGIARLTDLEHLRIRGGEIGDEGLRHICQLRSLRFLNLPQARLTDAGLSELHRLPHLELLRIGSPLITDAGMAEIAGLRSLRWLHLIDIPITDAGLRRLHDMKQLESLYLDGSRVTDEGFTRLFEAQPGLHVHVNQQHHDRDPERSPLEPQPGATQLQ
jgi:hypothetical protein